MKQKVYSINGKEIRDIELDDTVFGLPQNEVVIWDAINNELANRRLGTASTKDRGEVHGSNAKPYKQKGTGRARRGDKKSPVLVGGGTVFGPKPRNFSYSMPRKAKRLALKTILSLKVKNDMIKIVEDFSVDSGKTKDMVKILKNFGEQQRTVLIFKDHDPLKSPDDAENVALKATSTLVRRSGANIPYFSFLGYDRLSAHELFYGRRVILTETAVKSLNAFYGAKSEGE
jgi:large subunit ribosomal protein L4